MTVLHPQQQHYQTPHPLRRPRRRLPADTSSSQLSASSASPALTSLTVTFPPMASSTAITARTTSMTNTREISASTSPTTRSASASSASIHSILACSRSLTTRMVITVLVLTMLATSTEGHGMMCEPCQRGAYVSSRCPSNPGVPENPVVDYCPHCLNGGTVSVVGATLKNKWTIYDPIKSFDFRAGLCGDPAGSNDHMIGGTFMPLSYETVPIVAHYKTGAKIDFTAQIDTSHNGYFEFFLCNLDKCKTSDISAKCFQQGHCVKLDRVAHNDCENPSHKTHHTCGPIDAAYPGRWYLPCRNMTGSNIVGGNLGTMRYKLPDGWTCDHCVIQWYWATANSCAPRGTHEYKNNYNYPFGTTCDSDGGGRGTFRDNMAPCGGALVPEEFWSCADIQITNSGKAAGPIKTIPDIPVSASPSPAGDGVHTNPREVLDEAQDEILKDMAMAAHERSGERKRRERRAADGDCLLEHDVCDGSVRCCHNHQVCVYRSTSSSFRCNYWWALWEEAESNDRTYPSM